ncbi:DUF481 domain-containing protein [Niabella beijingensis]|uniref:DUF481 domain-containing protein n=1 Tax=Niabella beijingensis TaxID=2872700 RepID=UPI001CBEE068|nr:DUF481 domain-containing protein [Niabella beijingensis]MBZ4191736.1 DUF481 domain-containing protein [Niabella beijingensis]
MDRICLILLFSLLQQAAAAQFNDSVNHYLNAGLSGTLNQSAGNKNYLLNNAVKYGFYKRKSGLNFNAGWIYGQNNDGVTNNDFTTALDFNIYRDTASRFNYWGLTAYTTSYSLKINNQFQGGLGGAYKLVDNPRLYLRVSDGILFEQSDIIRPDSIRERYNTFRNSLRLQLKWYPYRILSFESTSFWQPSLKNSSDYIITCQLGLNLRLIKWLSLSTNLNYNRLSRTNKENLLFTYGLVFERYF